MLRVRNAECGMRSADYEPVSQTGKICIFELGAYLRFAI